MSKTKALPDIEQEATLPKYRLTEKGLAVAKRKQSRVKVIDKLLPDKAFSSRSVDMVLQTMAKSPDTAISQGDVSEVLWRNFSKVIDELEGEGLIELVVSDGEGRQPKVDTSKVSKARLERIPDKPKQEKPTKDVYSDKKGERLARKHRKGWKKVKY